MKGNLLGPAGNSTVSVADTATAFNMIVGTIGTDATGTQSLPGGTQVQIDAASPPVSAAQTLRDRNVIAGSLSIGYGGASAIVLGNYIGVDQSGAHALILSDNAVVLRGGARHPLLAA